MYRQWVEGRSVFTTGTHSPRQEAVSYTTECTSKPATCCLSLSSVKQIGTSFGGDLMKLVFRVVLLVYC